MKLCLATIHSKPFLEKELEESKYMLESFYYYDEWETPLIKTAELFLLDSGAFTFMQAGHKKRTVEEYEAYLDRYIEFVKSHNIQHFIELDIDSVVGYPKVLQMREKLEREVGRQCIPVFHKSRGIEEWHRMCREYDYVAIGTMGEYKSRPDILMNLLKISARYGTKVHGLGFTGSNVERFPFYSVDSTSWTSGGRFGTIHYFKNGQINTYKKENCRTIDYKIVDKFNLEQWIKYQRYLEGR